MNLRIGSNTDAFATETRTESVVGATKGAARGRRLPAQQQCQREQRVARETYDRLIAAREKIAKLIPSLPHLSPIFLRLEREIELITAELSDDPVTRARAVIAARQS